jgi:hypothetical protein
MNCFWKCGVSKNDIVENPIVESIEDNSIDSLSDKTLAPTYNVQECSETITPECDTPECDTPEPVMEKQKQCKWFGTISIAYNNEQEYYILEKDDVIYFGRFPLEWALNHEPGSGPNECENCFKNGMHNEVFIGYCMRCAIDKYKGLCGRGFISPGVENYYDDINITSAFDKYLKGVDLDLVGKDYIWYGFNVEMEYCGHYDEKELDELLNY